MDATPPTRIGDPERNQVLEVLSRATAEGRLTMDEFSERSGAAFAAVTRAELDVLVADLPHGGGTLPAPGPGAVPPSATAATAATVPDAAPGAGAQPGVRPGRSRKRFVAIMSGARPRGRWRPPPEVTAFAFWGGAQIDLREALIESPVVEITAWAIMGGVEVVVPEGIPVDVGGCVLMGAVVDTTSTAPPLEGAPLVRVKGRGLWGGVTVRTGKPRRSREHRHAEARAARAGAGARAGAARRDDEPDAAARVADHIDAELPPEVGDRLTGHLRRAALPPPSVDDLVPPMPRDRRSRSRSARRGHLGHGARHGWAAPTAEPPPTPAGAVTTPPPPAPSPPDAGTARPAPAANGSDAGPGPAAGTDTPATDTRGTGVARDGEGPGPVQGDGVEGNVRPTGRVLTMLVSDICDSTTTAVRMGDQRWVEVLGAHDTLVREQVRRHHGTEVKAQGDGFLVTFTSARQAVLAGIAVQRAMAAHRAAHPDLDMHVRLGIHTGEVVERDGDIFGQNVAVAVRVCDAAEPDEVLVSGMTRDITEASGDLRFDAGREATLKGLSKPSRVYAAAWE